MAAKPPGHPPTFPFYANDFAVSATVEAMSTQAVGAYVLLLCKAWHQDPVGTIPDDHEILSKWARVSRREWNSISKSVLAAFNLVDGRYHQERMQREYQNILDHRKERAESGKKGGSKRWQKDSKGIAEPSGSYGTANSSGIANGMAKNGSSSSSSVLPPNPQGGTRSAIEEFNQGRRSRDQFRPITGDRSDLATLKAWVKLHDSEVIGRDPATFSYIVEAALRPTTELEFYRSVERISQGYSE